MSMTEAIRRMVASQIKPDVLLGIVTEFDASNWLATIKLNGGAEVDEVRVKAVINSEESGIFIEPKIGSYVLVGLIEGKVESLFIIAFSEIEKVRIKTTAIELNGDQYKGLVKLDELKANLDALKQYVLAMNTAIATALTSVGVGTAANGPAGTTAFNSAMSGQVINFQNMENTTVKHG